MGPIRTSDSPSPVRDILRYLCTNPDAKDTVEGVLKWWLRSSGWRREDVHDALEMLTRKGWIRKRTIGRCRHVYSVEQTRLDDIRDFLKEPATGA